MLRWPLGVVDIVYARRGDVPARAARRAGRRLRAHRPAVGTDAASLALPIGCPTAFPKPQPGWCATPAPTRGRRHVGAGGALVARRAGRAARAVGGRGRQLGRDGARVPRGGARVCGCSSTPVTSPTGAAIRASCSSSPTTCSCARASAGTRRCTSTIPGGVVDFARRARPPRRARLPRQAQRRVLRPPRERLAPRRPRAMGQRPRRPPPNDLNLRRCGS